MVIDEIIYDVNIIDEFIVMIIPIYF